MRTALVISSVLHAVLVLWALLTMERHKPELKLPPPDPVVTEIISESDLTKIRQGSRTAKLDEAQAKESPSKDTPKKEAPKPKPVVATPPPAAAEPPPPAKDEVKPPEPVKAEPVKQEPPMPEPPKQEPPKPEPDKAALDQKLEELAMLQAAEDKRKAEEDKLKAEEAARAKAKAEADAKAKALAKARADKAKADAKAKADKAKADALAKEKQKLDTDRLSALLDKAPDPKSAPAAAPAPAAPTKDKGPVKGAPDGRDPRNAANEASRLLGMIVGRIRERGCWNIQAGGQLAASQVPRIQFELNRDGSVRGEPRVMNPQSSPEFQLAADAAKSAVLKCQNFELPPDKYEMWKRVTLDFDPREMFQ